MKMRKLILLAASLIFLPAIAMAQETPQTEVMFGYSYFRFNPNGSGVNLNGWNASLAGNVSKSFGLMADFSGHYKSGSNLYLFLFGPKFASYTNRTITPSLHVLFGGARAGNGGSETTFAMALGGGIDVNVHKKLALRLAQADYVLTRFGDDNQNNVRLSFGLTLRFGSK
jgi:opacity protein-like surface antigen